MAAFKRTGFLYSSKPLFLQWHTTLLLVSVSQLATIDYGHTPPTQPPSLSASSLLLLAVALLKDQSDGGLGITAPIIVTPTPKRIHTLSAKASSTPTSGGC